MTDEAARELRLAFVHTLESLQATGDVDSYTSGRRGAATNWMLANQERVS